MKTIQQYGALLLITGTLLSASCKTDSIKPGTGTANPGTGTTDPGTGATNPGSGAASPQLSRIDQDAGNYSVFTYNQQGQVANYVNLNNGNKTTVYATYGANKKPVSAVVNNQLYKFNYNGEQVEKVEVYPDKNTSVLGFYTTYKYTGNRISETDLYSKLGGANFTDILKITSDYDSDGDIKTQKSYYWDPIGAAMKLTSTTTYVYDTKINPLVAINDFTAVIFGLQSAHNVVKEEIYDGSNNLSQTDTYTISYDSKGYPLQSQLRAVRPGVADEVKVSRFTYK